MRDMRDKHLTSEEIIKYMDESDMSEDYLLWMEETAEHILTCDLCQEKLNRAMAAESVCDEEGLKAGLKLMEHEEEIRQNILITHLIRMQEQARIAEYIRHMQSGYAEGSMFSFSMTDLRRSADTVRGADSQNGQQARIAELIRHIQSGYVERFMFSMSDLQRSAGTVRGADSQQGQQVTLEKAEDKLLLRIPGEMGKGKRTGTQEACGNGRKNKLTVILHMEDKKPVIKEALWDEACGQYVAEVDGCGQGEELEIYIDNCEDGE